jgi:16S rRNA processing protein RimM
MDNFKYVHIGKLVATFGVEGSLILVHSLGKKQTLKDVKAILVEEIKGSQIPHFITKTQAKTTEETLINLENIATKEAAKRLVGKPVWLLQDDFRRLVKKESSIALLGYAVFDEDKLIGEVEEIIEQPHQVLLKVTYQQKEVLLPLHQDSLINISHTKKTVTLILPEGLLEIYLG